MNIYVGNLPFTTTAEELRTLLGQFGPVGRCSIVLDQFTSRSRGFGFGELLHGVEAAIAALHGSTFQGRTLTVSSARPRQHRARIGSRVGGGV